MAALPAQAEKANRILFFEQANRISVGKQQTTGQKGRHTETETERAHDAATD